MGRSEPQAARAVAAVCITDTQSVTHSQRPCYRLTVQGTPGFRWAGGTHRECARSDILLSVGDLLKRMDGSVCG